MPRQPVSPAENLATPSSNPGEGSPESGGALTFVLTVYYITSEEHLMLTCTLLCHTWKIQCTVWRSTKLLSICVLVLALQGTKLEQHEENVLLRRNYEYVSPTSGPRFWAMKIPTLAKISPTSPNRPTKPSNQLLYLNWRGLNKLLVRWKLSPPGICNR